jgi:hypothetical protein
MTALLLFMLNWEPLSPEMCDILLQNIKQSQSVSEEQKLSIWLECRLKAAQQELTAERLKEERECSNNQC